MAFSSRCQLGILLLHTLELLVPRGTRALGPARRSRRRNRPAPPSGTRNLLIRRPAVGLLGQPHFLFAQRGAVRLMAVGLVRRAVADHAADDNQRGPIRGSAEIAPAPLDRRHVVGVVHPDDVFQPKPSNRCRHVLAEGQLRLAFDRDAVVVVDPAQIGELQVAGQRSRFATDAFHQVAVAAQGVDVVVEQLEARPVVAGSQPAGGHGHAHAVADTLPQRPGRRLDARRIAVFRMPGAGLPSWRKFWMSSSETATPCRRAPCGSTSLTPARWSSDRAASRRGRRTARTGRGPARGERPDRSGARGSTARRPTGAKAIGVPGCPLLACCTASIDRVRIVLMANCSMLERETAIARCS